jgi:hypothetical protein
MKNNNEMDPVQSMLKYDIETLENLMVLWKPYIDTVEEKLDYDAKMESIKQLKKVYEKTYGKL